MGIPDNMYAQTCTLFAYLAVRDIKNVKCIIIFKYGTNGNAFVRCTVRAMEGRKPNFCENIQWWFLVSRIRFLAHRQKKEDGNSFRDKTENIFGSSTIGLAIWNIYAKSLFSKNLEQNVL